MEKLAAFSLPMLKTVTGYGSEENYMQLVLRKSLDLIF
jgi:hypothetical protein